MRKCSQCEKKPAIQGRILCHTCTKRNYRARNPMKAAYTNLKQNAKRRNKEFTLTFEEFSTFCNNTDYIIGKGRTAESFSIDRIDNDKGYTIDNLRLLTIAENASKHTKRLEYNWQDHSAKMVNNFQPLNGPF